MKKTVMFPIEVPENDFCMNYKTNEVCRFFENQFGTPRCGLGFIIPWEYDIDSGVLKPLKCRELLTKEEMV